MDILTRHKPKRSLLTLLAVIVGILLVSGYFYQSVPIKKDLISSLLPVDTSLSITSSLRSGTYKPPFTIKLKSNIEGLIHYTMDGSDPDIMSPVFNSDITINESMKNSFMYIPTSPRWHRPQRDFKKGIVLKCRLYTPDGKSSPVFTHSYIVKEPESNLPVISLVCDSADLFGYKSGIYVMGKAYEDKDNYVRKHINLDRSWWYYPGNYQKRGANSIRVCYYNDLGSGDFGKASLRIHGNATRGFSQKSLRLTVADSGDGYKDSVNLVLRNSGNDFTRSLIRDALASSIINDHSELDISVPEAYSVYINAEYWGLQWKGTRLDENYLRSEYSLPADQFSIVELPGDLFFGKKSDYRSFMDLKKFVRSTDLSKIENYKIVSEQIDIPGLIDYVLFQLYLGNTDWPFNNVRLYKQTGTNVSKWKFMVYDLDYTFGYSSDATADPFYTFEKDQAVGAFFRSLLQNAQFKEKLLERFDTLAATAFKKESVLHKADSILSIIKNDVPLHISRWRNPVSIEVWNNSIQDIKTFASVRPEHFRSWLIASINRNSKVNINTNNTEGSADSH